MKFHIGQTVRCYNSYNLEDYLTPDKKYVVQSIDVKEGKIYLEIIDDKGNQHFADHDRFRPIIKYLNNGDVYRTSYRK